MTRGLFPALGVLATASVVVALATGSVAIPPERLLALLTGEAAPLDRALVLELRLPRALAAFAVGGLLALAGALMQVLLRNPLADPYILGISGGAACAALGAMLLGLGAAWVSGSAFAGALLAMLLVFALGRGGGDWSPTRLLLTGVVIAAGWGAVISFLLATSPDRSLPGMLFWLMGDLGAGATTAVGPGLGWAILAAGLAAALALSGQLNVLAHGDLAARSLGIELARLRGAVYLLASLLTATAVTLAGTIGFVGLVTPHMLRLLGLTDHRRLLPACVLLGGALLLFADTAARTLLAPRQLPTGVVTALIGVPLFLYLLRRGDGRHV
ncbi:MAG: iron ABC transporter permease [Gammaproteobacteria bacterium]|nr:iron ABC transporter permease [Gammaproteobacteria bacterium]